MTRAPLRFLLTVLLLWAGVRAAILLPGLPGELPPVSAAVASPRPIGSEPARATSRASEASVQWPDTTAIRQAGSDFSPELPIAGVTGSRVQPVTPLATTLPERTLQAVPKSAAAPPSLAPPAPPPRAGPSRWSASAWLLLRDEGGGPSLAAGGTLGGSQAGARLTYSPGGGLALSGRVYLPVRHRGGGELAAGIDWRPVAALPLYLLAERRQRLGRGGRNAFALTLYGGTSPALAPRLRLDLYGQAGVVGLRRRDLFVDASARLSRRIGPVELGAGAWGAAQPGAARLDAGPSLSWRLPVRRAGLRLHADWRFRIAGDAAPRSGPALTLAADF